MFTRSVFLTLAIITTVLWIKWAVPSNPGFLGAHNLEALMATLVLVTIAIICFNCRSKHEGERQLITKTILVILAIVSTIVWIKYFDSAVFVLGGMLALSLVSVVGTIAPDWLFGLFDQLSGAVPTMEQIHADQQHTAERPVVSDDTAEYSPFQEIMRSQNG